MKVSQAQVLTSKIGKEFEFQVLMSKNTYEVRGILEEVDLTYDDPHLYITVTGYHNPKYPNDKMYQVGRRQTVFLRKIKEWLELNNDKATEDK